MAFNLQSKSAQNQRKTKMNCPEGVHIIVKSDLANGGNLILGNLEAANNLKLLTDLNVGAILCVAKGYPTSHPKTAVPYSKYVPVQKQKQLGGYLEESLSFINQKLPTTNVLVHCGAGSDRSAGVVIAYLMRQGGLSQYDAQKQVQFQRKKTNLSQNVQNVLNKYEKKLNTIKNLKTKSRIDTGQQASFMDAQRNSQHLNVEQASENQNFSRASQRINTKQSCSKADYDEVRSRVSARSQSQTKPKISIKAPLKTPNPEESLRSYTKKTNQLDKSFALSHISSSRQAANTSRHQDQKSMVSAVSKTSKKSNASREQFNKKIQNLDKRNSEINQKISSVRAFFQAQSQRDKEEFQHEMASFQQLKSNINTHISQRKSRIQDRNKVTDMENPKVRDYVLESLQVYSRRM